MCQLGQQLVARCFDDRRARIVVLINAMAEAHQAEAALLIFGHVDVLLHVAAVGQDGFEHFDAGLVGPAVQRSPQAQMPAEIEANRLASRRADHAHRRRAAILFVIGMHDQQQVQRFDKVGVDLVRLARHREHHLQESSRSSDRSFCG